MYQQEGEDLLPHENNNNITCTGVKYIHHKFIAKRDGSESALSQITHPMQGTGHSWTVNIST